MVNHKERKLSASLLLMHITILFTEGVPHNHYSRTVDTSCSGRRNLVLSELPKAGAAVENFSQKVQVVLCIISSLHFCSSDAEHWVCGSSSKHVVGQTPMIFDREIFTPLDPLTV